MALPEQVWMQDFVRTLLPTAALLQPAALLAVLPLRVTPLAALLLCLAPLAALQLRGDPSFSVKDKLGHSQ